MTFDPVTAAWITAAAVTVLSLKLGMKLLRRILSYQFVIDVVFTLFLMWLWAGTYSGMFAAMFAGLIFSIVLWVLSWILGHEELERRACPHCGSIHRVWVHYRNGRSTDPEDI